MIAVKADNKEIRVNIPTEGMSAEAIRAFVDWLRVEAAARAQSFDRRRIA
jgi:hypothetical protein